MGNLPVDRPLGSQPNQFLPPSALSITTNSFRQWTAARLPIKLWAYVPPHGENETRWSGGRGARLVGASLQDRERSVRSRRFRAIDLQHAEVAPMVVRNYAVRLDAKLPRTAPKATCPTPPQRQRSTGDPKHRRHP